MASHNYASVRIQPTPLATPDLETSQQDDPNYIALEQMHQLESLDWRGGSNFWDGPHDDFCFVCGSSMELFGCQTCENCYHADCMTPSLDPEDVPTFWFCPHCVDMELHIPPTAPTDYLTPPSPTHQVTQIGVAESTGLSTLVTSDSSPGRSRITYDKHAPASTANPSTSFRGIQACAPPPPTSKTLNPSSNSENTQHSKTDNPTRKAKPARPKRSYSPPRKKSKYSAFSADVDKALAVIHAELESAAQNQRSEAHLHEKIKSLEQKLRLQDGQLLLSTRELELARRELAMVRTDTGSRDRENVELRDEVGRLREMVQRKDDELRDWRSKLKSMIGTGLD